MTGFRLLKRAVETFQVPGTRTAKEHLHDLKFTTLRLYNAICKGLRTGDIGCCVDIASTASNLITADSNMRQMLSTDEVNMKQLVFNFYLHEGEEHGGFNYPIPKQVKSFTSLRDKDNKVKDMALHIVIKMYDIWCHHDEETRCSRNPKYTYPVGAPWSIHE